MLYILILLALIASGSFLLASVQSEKNQELNKKLDSYLLIPTENYEKMVCVIEKKPVSYTCTNELGRSDSRMKLRRRYQDHLIFAWYDISIMNQEDLTRKALSLIAQHYPLYLTINDYIQHIKNPNESILNILYIGLLEDYLKTTSDPDSLNEEDYVKTI
jgi:hypothetical protein